MIHRFGLFSIPNSGTRSLSQMFIRSGFEYKRIHEETGDAPHFLFEHITHLVYARLAYYMSQQVPVVMPIRHPYLVYNSQRTARRDIDAMLHSWKWMLNILWHNVILIPIDIPEIRNQFMLELQPILGCKIPGDLMNKWPTINDYGNVNLKPEEVERVDPKLIKFCKEHEQELSMFYTFPD